MGLDLLEITMELEDELEIQFDEQELYALFQQGDATVRDFYRLLLQKTAATRHADWNSAHKPALLDFAFGTEMQISRFVWLYVRDCLEQATGVPQTKIGMTTSLEELLPASTRVVQWQTLQDVCRYPLPGLDYSARVRLMIQMLTLSLLAVDAFHLLFWFPALQPFWLMLLVIGIALFVDSYFRMLRLFANFRRALPSELLTVKDLCRHVLGSNAVAICDDLGIAYDDHSAAVWVALQNSLKKTLGVKNVEITPRAKLVHDLGVA